MSHDTNCPYCNAEIEINHDDGYGYEQDNLHEQQCHSCKKHFTFRTSMVFYYETFKADCLNGADHNFQPTTTIPIECTKMRCRHCEEVRYPTESEWIKIKSK